MVAKNNSPAMWSELPIPEEPKLSFPGSALSMAIKSATFFALELLPTINMCGVAATPTTGSKSFCPLNGNFGFAATLIARPFCANRMV